MIPVLNAEQMRLADRRTIGEIGLPGAVLMENAGAAVAQCICQRFGRASRPLIVCGKGNNGGDGFVTARRLTHLRPAVLLIGRRADVQGDARLHLDALERSGGEVSEIATEDDWTAVASRLARADLIVDALLGTGLREEPAGLARRVIADLIVHLATADTPVVAVDLPSGLSADTARVAWETMRASVTVTFGAPKWAHVLSPACECVGELVVADIGIPRRIIEESGADLWLLEHADARSVYPQRAADSHKGDFGHLLIVAGSLGKTGAALLSARAALSSGAGLVTLATAAPALALVAQGCAELMTEALPAAPSGGIAAEAVAAALDLASKRDAVVLGPGLGQDPATRAFVREFARECPTPLLVDADGLNALAAAAGEPADLAAIARRAAPTVMTPHPGEMARLMGSSTAEVQQDRLRSSQRLASASRGVVVLKGQRTLVAETQGRVAVNPTGNPGLATAGTGDVLAGVVGALLARRHSAWMAAAAGVYVHGLAGDRAAALKGPEAMLAGDVIECLSVALKEIGAAGA